MDTEIFEDEAMVYVIHAPEVRRVKIGVTADAPDKRLRTMQTGSPVELKLLALLPGGFARERELHAQYADRRTHGEWFDDSILSALLTPEAQA